MSAQDIKTFLDEFEKDPAIAERLPKAREQAKAALDALDEIQSLRQRVEMLEEHLRAISQSGIDRATKWAGMNAHDIARAALSPKVQEGE